MAILKKHLRLLKKSELHEITELLRIPVDDYFLKKDYVEVLYEHFAEDPGLEDSPALLEFLVRIKSPKRSSKLKPEGASTPTTVEDETTSTSESEEVAEKVTEGTLPEKTEDKVPEGKAQEESVQEEKIAEEDEEDADFVDKSNPTVQRLKDTVIDYSEVAKDYVTDLKLSLRDLNFSLREKMSHSQSVVGLELVFEVLYVVSYFFSTTQISEIAPQMMREKLPEGLLNTSVVDIHEYASLKFISILITWLVISVAVPAWVSYYVNFGLNNHKYCDPAIFSVCRVVSLLLLLKSDVTFEDIKDEFIYQYAKNSWSPMKGYYFVKSSYLHSSMSLRLIFGNIPLIGALVTSFTSIYGAIQNV